MKFLSITGLLAVVFAFAATPASAQTTSYWSQCPDNSTIVRCETYNCPNGDTNKDGSCDTKDTGAQLTESRNDSFCANPPSGCGQVLYYATNQTSSCAVRVKENANSCNLYKANTPLFGAAIAAPSASPVATNAPQSRLNVSPKPVATAKPNQTLPKTGPELWISIFVAALGMYGLYLYEKPKKDTH